MPEHGYIVVPFERVGSMLGPRQLLIFDAIGKARHFAQQIASQVPGVAIIERGVDPESGESVDRLVEDFGAVPPSCPSSWDWTLRLN